MPEGMLNEALSQAPGVVAVIFVVVRFLSHLRATEERFAKALQATEARFDTVLRDLYASHQTMERMAIDALHENTAMLGSVGGSLKDFRAGCYKHAGKQPPSAQTEMLSPAGGPGGEAGS